MSKGERRTKKRHGVQIRTDFLKQSVKSGFSLSVIEAFFSI